ncbi:MAG: hypothetical protein KA234_01100 [Saprospiraceae bacterium]|nr:hypothetical protein [Saprospiraceae bacterium]
MTRADQISQLKKVAASLSEYSSDIIDRSAKAAIMKAILILEKKIRITKKDDFYESVYGLRRMKISKDTRHKVDLMVEFAGKENNKPSLRMAVKEEIKRLTRFNSARIDEMLNDEIYLKRFQFIFG